MALAINASIMPVVRTTVLGFSWVKSDNYFVSAYRPTAITSAISTVVQKIHKKSIVYTAPCSGARVGLYYCYFGLQLTAVSA